MRVDSHSLLIALSYSNASILYTTRYTLLYIVSDRSVTDDVKIIVKDTNIIFNIILYISV